MAESKQALKVSAWAARAEMPKEEMESTRGTVYTFCAMNAVGGDGLKYGAFNNRYRESWGFQPIDSKGKSRGVFVSGPGLYLDKRSAVSAIMAEMGVPTCVVAILSAFGVSAVKGEYRIPF